MQDQVKSLFIAALFVFVRVTASDLPCINAQGACQYTTSPCSNGQYTSGLCDGAVNRKCCVPSAQGCTNRYGNINQLSPTGKANGGVAGSNSDVNSHLTNLNALKTCFDQVAGKYCIQASILGAIASRETGAGAFLDANGLGRWDANGYGIMQCDLKYSGLPCKNCAPKSCCHIEMMVKEKIIPDINYMKTKFPTLSVEQQVQAAVAAYNTGRSRVSGWSNIDASTTGKDYSNDVIARAQFLKTNKGWS